MATYYKILLCFELVKRLENVEREKSLNRSRLLNSGTYDSIKKTNKNKPRL